MFGNWYSLYMIGSDRDGCWIRLRGYTQASGSARLYFDTAVPWDKGWVMLKLRLKKFDSGRWSKKLAVMERGRCDIA